jgi:CRISPR-associated protein Csx3
MNLLPALVIGGPPHSGKSVLAYSLSQALRLLKIQHYVLRAYPPDCEGDWSHEADQALVRHIRIKGSNTTDWIAPLCRDIARRHLPLIVDVGGQPTEQQQAILSECTHAVLLAGDEAWHPTWQTLFARHGLMLLADLDSDLHGPSVLRETLPILRGTLSGLERGHIASGPVLDALVDRLSALFAYDDVELRRSHIQGAPVEMVVELARMGRALGLTADPFKWEPRHLPQVLDYLPSGVPLGLYDRGPNWLYAALALQAHPAALYQFDVRLGWVQPPVLQVEQPLDHAPLLVKLDQRDEHVRVECVLRDAYLDYAEAEGLVIPAVPAETGIVLNGKLPLWLWTALVLAYHNAPWIGIYQPQLHDQALVVQSRLEQPVVGQLVAA